VIISINYKISEDKFTQYNEHKRAYLTQTPSGKLRTLYAVQSQDFAPTILALRPTKNEHSIKINELTVKTNDTATKSNDITAKTSLRMQKPDSSLTKTTIPAVKTNSLTTKVEEPATKTSRPASSKSSLDKNEELHAFVEKWRSAWTTKDIEAYINCYSPSFKSGNLNRDEWRARKIFLNQKYKYITVQIRNIVVDWTSAGANVSFQQIYKSDQLQTSGRKTLQLVNKKNRWMIENETI
jgi:hypothetical protein